MHRGYIKLWRKSIEHARYPKGTSRQPMTRWEAWLHILLRVNHKPSKVSIKNQTFDCGPGESLRSIGSWAHEFGWSRSATHRFLKVLEKDNMLVLKSETVTVRLSVCNWEIYQDRPEHEPERERNASGTRAERKRSQLKNEKNEKNEKKGIPPTPLTPLDQAIADWAEHRRTIRKPATDKALVLARAKALKLADGDEAKAVELIHNAIELGWQGIYPKPKSRQQDEEQEDTNPIHQNWRKNL